MSLENTETSGSKLLLENPIVREVVILLLVKKIDFKSITKILSEHFGLNINKQILVYFSWKGAQIRTGKKYTEVIKTKRKIYESYSDCRIFLENNFFPSDKVTIEAEKIFDKYREKDNRFMKKSAEYKNRRWTENSSLFFGCLFLWSDPNIRASIYEIIAFLKSKKINVTRHQLETIFKHSEKRLDVYNKFSLPKISEIDKIEAEYEAKKFHDQYKENKIGEYVKMNKKKLEIKRRKDPELPAYFGLESIETRFWLKSSRAKSVAYVLIRRNFSYPKVAAIIQKFYGIATDEDSIKNGLGNFSSKFKVNIDEKPREIFLRKMKEELKYSDIKLALQHLEYIKEDN